MIRLATLPLLLTLLCGLNLAAQTQESASPSNAALKSSVPLLVKFSSTLLELNGSPSSGPQNVMFSLYEQQAGGETVWAEMENVLPDKDGNVTVLLGSTIPLGMPVSIFTSGLPRWVGMTPNDGVERPRVVLASVPYALKAVNADTLGGMGPGQFVSLQQLSSMLGGLKLNNPPISLRELPVTVPQDAYRNMRPLRRIAPSLISDATTLHGFTDADFAKTGQSNLFSQMQSFAGGTDLPASTPEPSASNLVDSAPLNFDSTLTDPQSGAKSTQRLTWVSQPTVGPNGAPSAKLSLFISINGASAPYLDGVVHQRRRDDKLPCLSAISRRH